MSQFVSYFDKNGLVAAEDLGDIATHRRAYQVNPFCSSRKCCLTQRTYVSHGKSYTVNALLPRMKKMASQVKDGKCPDCGSFVVWKKHGSRE